MNLARDINGLAVTSSELFAKVIESLELRMQWLSLVLQVNFGPSTAFISPLFIILAGRHHVSISTPAALFPLRSLYMYVILHINRYTSLWLTYGTA